MYIMLQLLKKNDTKFYLDVLLKVSLNFCDSWYCGLAYRQVLTLAILIYKNNQSIAFYF